MPFVAAVWKHFHVNVGVDMHLRPLESFTLRGVGAKESAWGQEGAAAVVAALDEA